jgi:hypothetical protein
MFAPFARQGGQPPEGSGAPDKPAGDKPAEGGEINDLKRQMEEMQKRIERLTDKDK